MLFVCSRLGDDGRRPGDGALPNPPLTPVPAKFWDSSQIFLSYPPGVPGQTAGAIANPMTLAPHAEYWVLALIGNAGSDGAGTVIDFQNPKCTIVGDAQAFGSFTSPGTSLPSLDNIDPASTNPVYEQLSLGGWAYAVVGFRFNVDAVFSQLEAALAALPPAMLACSRRRPG